MPPKDAMEESTPKESLVSKGEANQAKVDETEPEIKREEESAPKPVIGNERKQTEENPGTEVQSAAQGEKPKEEPSTDNKADPPPASEEGQEPTTETSTEPEAKPIPKEKPKPLTPDEILGKLKEPKPLTDITTEEAPALPEHSVKLEPGSTLQTPTKEELDNIRKFRLNDITNEEWSMIMNTNQLLHGYCPFLSEKGGLALAPQPAFRRPLSADLRWPHASNADNVQLTVTETTSTEESKVVKQGFSSMEVAAKVGASIDTMAIGGSVDMKNKNMSSTASTRKSESHSIIGKFWVPYAQLDLDISKVELTSQCTEWVEKIMKFKDVTDLNEFYTRYGRIFPQHVLLGGHLSTEVTIQSQRSAERTKSLEQFASSLQATLDVPLVVSGSLSVSDEIQNRSEKTTTSTSATKIEKWNSYGGDDALVTDTKQWRSSVRLTQNWRPIEFGNIGRLDLIIGRIDKYRKFPTIVDDILRIIQAPVVRSVPIAPCYSEEVLKLSSVQRAPKQIALYQGMDTLLGEFRPSPFDQAGIGKHPDQAFAAGHDWRVVASSSSLGKLLNDVQTQHCDEVNFTLAPSYLSNIHVSSDTAEYGVSIVLRWASGGKRFYIPEPDKVQLSAEASQILSKGKEYFRNAYGDSYVVNIERKTCLVCVWTVSFGTNAEDCKAFADAMEKKFVATESPGNGAQIIREYLNTAPRPDKRNNRVYLYTSEPNKQALVLNYDSDNLKDINEEIDKHLERQAAVIHHIQIHPYEHAVLGFGRTDALDQQGFVQWALALQNVYDGLNDIRKIASKDPARKDWEGELRALERRLLENQKKCLAGDEAIADDVSDSVKAIRKLVKAKIHKNHNTIGPLQAALEDWVARSKETEGYSIRNMELATFNWAMPFEHGQTEFSPLFAFRTEKGKSRKFGLTEPPVHLDGSVRAQLERVVKKSEETHEYINQFFDGKKRTQFHVEMARPGENFQLLAYEISNEWQDPSGGKFWIGPAINGRFVGSDMNFFKEPDNQVGRWQMEFYFARETLKSHRFKAVAWWVPERILDGHVAAS